MSKYRLQARLSATIAGSVCLIACTSDRDEETPGRLDMQALSFTTALEDADEHCAVANWFVYLEQHTSRRHLQRVARRKES